MHKMLLAVALTAAALPAGAAQLFVSTGTTVFNNGQVSDYAGKNGLVEERFAYDNLQQSCAQTRASTVQFSNLGAFGSAGLTLGVHRNRALPPGTNRASLDAGVPIADTSCYAVVPQVEALGVSSTVDVAIAAAAKLPTLYFGFYWGSLDGYNSIVLKSRPDKTDTSTPIIISGLSQPDGTILGSDLLALLGKTAGYNTYVGFRFTAADNFQTITFGSNNRGFEIDNLAYSVNDFLSTPPPGSTVFGTAPAVVGPGLRPALVPEPAALGLFAAALGLTGFARRRRT